MYDHTVANSMVQRGREREGQVADLVSVRTFGIMYDHTVLNSIVRRRTMGTLCRRKRDRWVDLGCLMINGFSKNIRCHV